MLLFFSLICVAVSIEPSYIAANTPPAYLPNVEWYTCNGKTADPCATEDQLNAIRRDCLSPKLPSASTTVLLPVDGALFDSNNVKVASPAALTISGRNFVDGNFRLAQPEASCSNVEPTTVLSQQTATSSADGTTLTLDLTNNNWWSADKNLEFEGLPRQLCFQPGNVGQYFWSGFHIGIVWSCTAGGTRGCGNLPPNADKLSPTRVLLRSLRTQCCIHSLYGATPTAFTIGQCINPNVQTCCQGAAVDPVLERCCSTTYEQVVYHQQPCPCKSNSANGPTCPTGENCCIHTKYPEISALHVSSVWPQFSGECYNNQTHQCCDTGSRFDPGTHRCCNITGIQSRNFPCPCSNNQDCQSGTTPNGLLFGVEGGQFCCLQDMPYPYESIYSYASLNDGTSSISRCNKYSNYPTGQSAPQAQQCLGVCIDTRYQMCCNGAVCKREYDKCCNSTCCNKFIGTCSPAYRPGTPGNLHNWNEYGIPYEICTTIEQYSAPKAFWIFVLPVYLLLATVLGIAVVVAYISASSRRSYSILERAEILVAFACIALAFPCFFAPIYKYGVVIIWTSFTVVVMAAARKTWLNAVTVVLLLVTVLYLFDPFTGNNYFTFASLRTSNGDTDPESAGFLYAILRMAANPATCVKYYDYFQHDTQLQDPRWENLQVSTFGYCSRGWVTALLIFELSALILSILNFILCFISLILKFKEERSYDPIELEVRGVEETPIVTAPIPAAPYY